MKDIDKIKALSAEELGVEMKRLMNHPFSSHINYAAWLESDDADVTNFILSELSNLKAAFFHPKTTISHC